MRPAGQVERRPRSPPRTEPSRDEQDPPAPTDQAAPGRRLEHVPSPRLAGPRLRLGDRPRPDRALRRLRQDAADALPSPRHPRSPGRTVGPVPAPGRRTGPQGVVRLLGLRREAPRQADRRSRSRPLPDRRAITARLGPIAYRSGNAYRRDQPDRRLARSARRTSRVPAFRLHYRSEKRNDRRQRAL